MAHTAPSPFSVRAASLSASTVFWAGLLIAMLSAGPRIVTFIPSEPAPLTGIEIVDPPPTPSEPHTSQPIRQLEGAAAFMAPLPTVPATEILTGPASIAPPAPAATPDVVVVSPVWLRRPSAAELQRYYPDHALRREKEGFVSLACLVRTDGALACSVAEETPAGWGFGQAALRISQAYRMQPATRDGQAVEARYTLRVPFQLH